MAGAGPLAIPLGAALLRPDMGRTMDAEAEHDPRLQRLLDSLPGFARRGFEAAWRPRSRPWRIPLAIVTIGAGFVGFLPVLGFWMVPVGMLLLSRDVPALHEPTLRGLSAAQRGWGWVTRKWGKGQR